MRVILPNPRGFCAGVRMAIEVLDRVLELFDERPIYAFHEIVHNTHVVASFRQRGVEFVDDVALVPPGRTVVFSAHGVSPDVRRQAEARGLNVIDATCPLVTKVHAEAARYARQGYEILLVGHAHHQEIIGTRGEAPHATQVVESVEDVARLRVRDPTRLVYLTQTTLSIDDAAAIVAALRAQFPAIKGPPTDDICYATTNRQQAVRRLAPQCDLVLVVGSRQSSNSNRLVDIARSVGTPAHLIEDASAIDHRWFPTGSETVLLTAGASAPEALVAEVCRVLVKRYGGRIEQHDVYQEDVEFALPAGLRRQMRARGVAVPAAGVRVGSAVLSAQQYGTVPLTVSAPAAPPTSSPDPAPPRAVGTD